MGIFSRTQRRIGIEIGPLVALLLLAAAPRKAQAAPASARCVMSMNSAARKVARAQARLVPECLRDAYRSGTSDVRACWLADETGRVAKAQARAIEQDVGGGSDRCAGVEPPSLYTGARVTNAVAVAASSYLAEDLFGDVDAAVAMHLSPDAQRCARHVYDRAGKHLDAVLKTFNRCKSGLLRTALPEGSVVENTCYSDGGRNLVDPTSRLPRSRASLLRAVRSSCIDSGLDTDDLFPGACVGHTGDPDFGGCVISLVRCRSCQMLNDADRLLVDCDLFDDAQPNGSCTAPHIFTPTPTETAPATVTATATASDTPSLTPTFTPTSSPTTTASETATATDTSTPTATATSTASETPTATPTPTATDTTTPTETPTATTTDTPSLTPTSTETSSPTMTATETATATITSTATATPTPCRTFTGRLLVSINNEVVEFTLAGSEVQRFLVPAAGNPDNKIRDVVVDACGGIFGYQGTFQPKVAYLAPNTATWAYWSDPDFGTTNNLSFGGLALTSSHLLASSQAHAQGGGNGVMHFELGSGAASLFEPGFGPIDVAVGGANQIYALRVSGRDISIFDATSLALAGTVHVEPLIRGIAVTSAGVIYGVGDDGVVYAFGASGNIVDSRSVGIGVLYDIDIAADGTIAVGSRNGGVGITDISLDTVSTFVAASVRTFVAFTPNGSL